MYFLIVDDELLEKNNDIWSNSIKKDFDRESISEHFWKPK